MMQSQTQIETLKWNNCIGFFTLLRKEIVRIIRIWPQTLLPSMITTALYFAIFGSFIGSRIGQLHGVSYIEFITPGLVMMAVITNSYSSVSSSFFSSKFQRCTEELLVSTMSTNSIVLGFVIGGVIRGAMVGLGVILVALFFTKINVAHIGLLITLGVLVSFLFSLAGLFNGMFAKSFDDITIIPTFVLTPLTYLGGVFYSISLLSPLWQKLSLLNPIVYIVNGFRYGMLGFSDVNIYMSIIIMLALSVILYVIILMMFRKVCS